MADSDVKLKHKVQLRKKVEEQESTSETPKPTPQSRKSMIWMCGVGGVIVVGLLIWWLATMGTNNEVPKEKQQPVVEEVTEAPTNVEEGIESPAVPKVSETDVNNPSNVQEVEQPEASPSAPVHSQKPTIPQTTPTTSSNSQVNVSTDVEAEAMKVIRGDYGIGQERKNKLGDNYQTIQNRVNELKKEGVF